MEKYRTKRLSIREANADDAGFIFNLLNSPTWIEHIGDRKIRTLKDAENYIQEALTKSYKRNGFGLYIMEELSLSVSIGLCGLLKREELDHVDIGFAILPNFTRKGYTYEAAATIIKNCDYEVVYGITYEGNLGSRKLLEKLGLKHVRNFQFGNFEAESMLFSNEVL